jgi:quercetin dioxygenase-like cupin family protein
MSNVVLDYKTAASFSPEQFTPVPFGQSERSRALLVCLEPGQFIPIHSPGVDITFVILEGEGTLVAGDHETEVRPGALAFAAAFSS